MTVLVVVQVALIALLLVALGLVVAVATRSSYIVVQVAYGSSPIVRTAVTSTNILNGRIDRASVGIFAGKLGE